MKQKLLKTLVAFLAIAAAATGPAWGQNASPDVTLDFTTNTWGFPEGKINKTYAANSYTSGDYTITLQGGGSSSNGYYFNSGYLLLGQTGAYLQLPEFESAVDSIQVVGTSGASAQVTQNVYVDENNSLVAVSTQTGARGTNTYVINENYRAAGNIYFIKVDNSYNTQITYIKVYYASSGGGSGSETPTPGQNENLLTTVTPTGLTTYNETTPGVVNVTLDGQLEYDNNDGWKAEYGNGNQGSVTVTATPGFSIDSCKFYVYYNSSYQYSYTVTAAPFAVYPYCHGSMGKVFTQPNAQGIELGYGGVKRIEVYGTVLPPQPHTVQLAEGTEEAANWTLASGNASVPGTQVLEGILAGTPLTATYNGDLKIKEVIATKHQELNPLTIEALTAGTVVVNNPQSGMQYTLNGGAKTPMTESPTEITVAVGDKVQLYGNGTSITSYDGTGIYDGTADVKVYGNIMSLVNETGFDTATTLTANGAFTYLFVNYVNLKDISGLKLPATTLTQSCYYGMFSSCTGLTTVPSDLLPATTMAISCYSGMFDGCANLTNVPTLPATTLAVGCYNRMFSVCIGLTTVPTDLLPATTLAEACYSSMFLNCRNLTTAPALPATTLAARCYYCMFQRCENLADSPVLPATTLVERCYNYMFANCYNLRSVTCLATSGINQNNSTTSWLQSAGEAVQGTKIFNAVSTATWPTSVSGIPSVWTRQNIDN